MSEEQEKYITDVQKILRDSKPLSSRCGVYFLISNDKIVYVGQSVNIPSRIEQHKKDPCKEFDRYHSIPCKVTELDLVESNYIRKFMPKFNKAIPGEDKCTRRFDYTFIWFHTPELHIFPLITIREWMKSEGISGNDDVTEESFIGFLVFAEWWKFTHKGFEYSCLPDDVCRWVSAGRPSAEDLRNE